MTAHTSPKVQNNAELTEHEIAALLQIASRLEEMHQSLIRMKNLVPTSSMGSGIAARSTGKQ
jgi:hypothetical protein